jgi:hypothetical protein
VNDKTDQVLHILIDSRGAEWDLSEPWLYRHLGFVGTATEMTDFVIRNLGYVSLRIEGQRVTIRVRPDYFSEAAFEKLVAKIGFVEPARIIVKAEIDGPDCVDILSDPSDAIAHLHELRVSRTRSSRTKFFADVLSLDRLAEQPGNQITDAYRRWCQARGRLPRHSARTMLDDPLHAPWLLGSLEKGKGLVTRTVPEYITFWNTSERADLIDTPMVAHPDSEFGKAAEKTYLAVHRDERPVLELVSTVVQPPGGLLHWGRYQRLILPWRTSDGGLLLSSVSAVKVARDLASAALA